MGITKKYSQAGLRILISPLEIQEYISEQWDLRSQGKAKASVDWLELERTVRAIYKLSPEDATAVQKLALVSDAFGAWTGRGVL